MWSLGAIFAEMHLGAPLFRGEDDNGEGDGELERVKQITQIYRLLGTPTAESWKARAQRRPQHAYLFSVSSLNYHGCRFTEIVWLHFPRIALFSFGLTWLTS